MLQRIFFFEALKGTESLNFGTDKKYMYKLENIHNQRPIGLYQILPLAVLGNKGNKPKRHFCGQ